MGRCAAHRVRRRRRHEHRDGRIDKATHAVEHLTLTGDLPSWPDGAPTQESVVVFHDGTRLNLWNYSVDADRDAFFRLDLEPTSGAGTQEDPYVLTAERDQRPVSTMPAPALTYDLTYIDDWASCCSCRRPARSCGRSSSDASERRASSPTHHGRGRWRRRFTVRGPAPVDLQPRRADGAR